MSTGLGVLVLIGLALALEAWSLMNRKEGDTISEVVTRNVYRYPFIAFLLGFLLGHWVWK